MSNKNYDKFCEILRSTAIEAGMEIIRVREEGLGVSYKSDQSPVTVADQAAEKIILRDLATVAPDIPVVAEESFSDGKRPTIENNFWLVDPLDGTKEFIAGGTDFTVNIALIENGEPTFGIIYTPAKRKLYTAKSTNEATLQQVDESGAIGEEVNISVREAQEGNLTALASKSHLDAETENFLEEMKIDNRTSAGSSLKFCVVAEGNADIYPRFGPTMEWDIAAGHAILKAAGGSVTNPDGSPFQYQKPGFKNGAFIAKGNLG